MSNRKRQMAKTRKADQKARLAARHEMQPTLRAIARVEPGNLLVRWPFGTTKKAV